MIIFNISFFNSCACNILWVFNNTFFVRCTVITCLTRITNHICFLCHTRLLFITHCLSFISLSFIDNNSFYTSDHTIIIINCESFFTIIVIAIIIFCIPCINCSCITRSCTFILNFIGNFNFSTCFASRTMNWSSWSNSIFFFSCFAIHVFHDYCRTLCITCYITCCSKPSVWSKRITSIR